MKTQLPLLLAIVGIVLSDVPLKDAHAADQLTGDVSSRLIAITSNYTGAELILFGSRIGEGDVVAVVRGPTQSDVVRRKTRFAGIWVNTEALIFDEVPGFYAVAASRPLPEIAKQALWSQLQIGAEYLKLDPREDVTDVKVYPYREALINNKEKGGLYLRQVGKINFIGNTLFRTSVELPAYAPVGGYFVMFYLIEGGEVVETRNTFFFINKTGLERAVFDFAINEPAAYGLLAVAIAVFAGWLAGVMFRRA